VKFNQQVNNLPEPLTSLTFGVKFNQQVDNLPQTLTSLTFGNCFNQRVDNLPKSLTSLTFDKTFNQKLCLQNFPLLKLLKLSKNYNNLELEEYPLTLKNIVYQ
jgi:hypothetical protein